MSYRVADLLCSTLLNAALAGCVFLLFLACRPPADPFAAALRQSVPPVPLPPPGRPLTLIVRADGSLSLSTRAVTLAEIAQTLRQAAADPARRPVWVVGERTTSMRVVLPVLELCQRLGVQSVQMRYVRGALKPPEPAK